MSSRASSSAGQPSTRAELEAGLTMGYETVEDRLNRDDIDAKDRQESEGGG